MYAGTDDVDDEAVRIIAANSLISKATRVAYGSGTWLRGTTNKFSYCFIIM